MDRIKNATEVLDDATLAVFFPFDSSSLKINVTGLRRIGMDNWPYSISIWIKPTSLAGGTIVHLSNTIDGSASDWWCLSIMGLISSEQIAINNWNSISIPIKGPAFFHAKD